MTAKDLAAELEPGEVYMLTTTDNESLIGEYAGQDDRGRIVVASGPFEPLHIPASKVADWMRLS